MPVYEYQCKACGRDFEYQQRMSDPDKTACEMCGGALDRLISRTAFTLKGSGWYKDLYASAKPANQAEGGKAEGGGDGKPDGKPDKPGKSDVAASADKPAAKTSDSTSGSGSSSGSTGSSGTSGTSGSSGSSGSVAKAS